MIRLKSILKHFIPSSLVRQKLPRPGTLLLTFDDGPHPEITSQVLDLLDEFQARGLFFVVGNRAEKNPDLLREIVERRHQIGNHTYSHIPCNRLNVKQIVDEIDRCHNVIQMATKFETRLFRPPKGIITPQTLIASRRTRHSVVRWSIDCGEYSYARNASVDERAQLLLKRVHDRAIIVAHDDHAATPDLLRRILPALRDRGIDLRSGVDTLLSDD